MSERLVWFVTGASRGFGLEITRQALARGDAVVATARDAGKIEASLGGASPSLLPVALVIARAKDSRAAVRAGQAAVDALLDGLFGREPPRSIR